MSDKMKNITDRMKMPQLTIDGTGDMPGIKKMYDIAFALKDSIMQWSGHGVGKSQAVRQWNQSKVEEYEKRIKEGEDVKPWNPEVCDVRLAMKEPVDMIGIPVITEIDHEQKTVWAVPSIWPKEGEYSGGVIHLDEMNQGQAAVLNASFQLILDRQLGDYKVPDNYLIIGSANPPAYNATVTEFSLPLANRFTHFNIGVDFDSWLNYRMNNNGNLDVMSFLKTQDSSLLFDKEAIERQIGESIESAMFTDITITPRSWEVVEHLLDLKGFTTEEKKIYATGRLGLSVATRLFNYIKDKEKYQSWKEILVDGKEFRESGKNGTQFWVTQMACLSAINNEKNDETCRKYVLNLLKAIRKVAKPLQAITITNMTHCKRLAGNISLFNPLNDAMDIMNTVATAMAS